MENLTWKKVAHWDNKKLFRDVVEFMDAVWAAGYEFGCYTDGAIYSMDNKGQVVLTNFKEEDIA